MGILINAVRLAFKETEFLDYIAGAIADRIRASAAVHSAVAEINTVIDQIDDKVNDDNPKTYFLKRLVVAQLREMAAENSTIAVGLAQADTYLPAVLDGISVDEVLTASVPLKDLIAQRAYEIANRQLQ